MSSGQMSTPIESRLLVSSAVPIAFILSDQDTMSASRSAYDASRAGVDVRISEYLSAGSAPLEFMTTTISTRSGQSSLFVL